MSHIDRWSSLDFHREFFQSGDEDSHYGMDDRKTIYIYMYIHQVLTLCLSSSNFTQLLFIWPIEIVDVATENAGTTLDEAFEAWQTA